MPTEFRKAHNAKFRLLERARVLHAKEITLRMIAAYVRDEGRIKSASRHGKASGVSREEFYRLYGQVGDAMKGLSKKRKEEFRNWWDTEVKKVNMHPGVIGGW